VNHEPLALDTVVFARGLHTPPGIVPALSDIALDILPGEIFSIVGRAGSGKTMLLEALIGLRSVAAERLQVCGADPRRFPAAVKQKIGVARRDVDVDRKMTVEEALRLFARLYARADAEQALSWLGLAAVRGKTVDALPADLRQRVSLALALVNDPVVLFADEPTRELDPEGARVVWDLLQRRRERGRTSILTTNHLDEAARLSDRVAILNEGRLLAVDTPAALMARSHAPVRVTVELLKASVPLDELRALPGVLQVHVDRAEYVLATHDGVATLRAALRLIEQRELRPLAIGLRQQTLEDVFFEMTAPARTTAGALA
jgi:ABC-2 type transport system ATP-binding protein